MTTRKDVEVALADYKHKLTFTWKEDCAIITKPYDRSEKGKEEWGKIMAIVRSELNGKWVSLGADSHWVVPLEVKAGQKQQGNHGTYGTLHCPHCGKSIEITFKPKKEATS